MGFDTVTLVLELPFPPLPNADAPVALASLALLLPLAGAPMVLVSAALGSPLSWGYFLICIPFWTEYRSLSSSGLTGMGLSAASSPSGRLLLVDPLVAYPPPLIHFNSPPGVLASKRRSPYFGQCSQFFCQSVERYQPGKYSLDFTVG